MAHVKSAFQPKFQNTFYYFVGIGFVSLAKAKHLLKGYSSPKPFAVSEYEKSIKYDIGVVENWLPNLRNYTKGNYNLVGKRILELGPGSDLGVGLYLLSKEIAQYNAIDINNLVKTVPPRFYELFFEYLQKIDDKSDIEFLKGELTKTNAGNNDKLNFICRNDFDISSAFDKNSIDIVFSQAAFEHFDDIDKTVRQLSLVVKSGGIIIAEIDLQTHSRWIRDKDPNNIYRYNQTIYNLFRFSGTPNRVRPYRYKNSFEKHGWKNVSIMPLTRLTEDGLYRLANSLHRDFSDEINQMEYLTIILCATKI
jgi:SAM-dependent methyltransferase